ncbi:MAG: hypothetical protein J0I32_02815 [Sphingobacteriales bacterium]|nr:hypothetical protein [Sphingobacteriales bacterium]OJW04944.1 MAG: hypothetical protein BGO52_20875 [Sphingobacteriales bacterium 44-61]
MSKALIKLAFRQEIDVTATGSFEKDVFNDSYQEFLMQAQAYNPNGQFHTLQELIANNPKANSLHYKVGFSVGLYIAGLNGVIPGIKEWVPGQVQPGFETHQFEIIRSHLSDHLQHGVAITYFTGVLSLLGSFGDQLLLATGDMTHLAASEWADSFMLKINPMITICQYSPMRAEMGLPRLAN